MVASASVFSHNASEFMHSALGANFTTFSNMVPQCLFSFLGCFPICTFVQLFWWRLDLVMSLAQCNHFLTPQAVSGIAPLTISLRVALTIPLPVIVLCINKREPRMGPAGCVSSVRFKFQEIKITVFELWLPSLLSSYSWKHRS